MPTDEHAAQNIKTSHAATDDVSSDVDESNAAISTADLDSSSFYTKGLLVTPFPGEKQLKRTLGLQSKRLADGETELEFYAFCRVPQELVDRIDKNPRLLGCRSRITYFSNEEVMIVQLASDLHDLAHAEFGLAIFEQVLRMGLTRRDFVPSAGARMQGRVSSEEGDSSFKPLPARQRRGAFPTIVIEAGLSQSRQSLRTMAMWRVSNSNGDVKIVIIISIYERTKRLVFEKWCDLPGTINVATRHPRGPGDSPGLVQTVTVSHIPNTPVNLLTSYNVVGQNLILEFDKVFLRQPVGQEGDITFGVPELQEFAMIVWGSLV